MIYTGCSNQYREEIKGSNINIKNDSLFWQTAFMNRYHTLTPLKLIKNIYYTTYNSLSPVNFNGSIKLNNDSIFEVRNAEKFISKFK
jgi:hypothetical protein